MSLLKKIVSFIKEKLSFFSRKKRSKNFIRQIELKDYSLEKKTEEKVEEFVKNYYLQSTEEITSELTDFVQDITFSELKNNFDFAKSLNKESAILELESQLQTLNKKIVLLKYSLNNIHLASTDALTDTPVPIFIAPLNFGIKKINDSFLQAELCQLENLTVGESLVDKYITQRSKLFEESLKRNQINAQLSELDRLIYIEEFIAARALINEIDTDSNRENFAFFRKGIGELKSRLIRKETENKQNELVQKEIQRQLAEEALIEQKRIELEQKAVSAKQKEEAIENEKQKSLESLLVKKRNWEEFAKILSDNSISKLYHFTDKSNLQSIRQNGGLYSWSYCDANNIKIIRPGGDMDSRVLDRRYNLHDYVRLSLTRSHPMMYVAQKDGRIPEPIVIEVDLGVAFFEKTKFSDMNATKTGHTTGSDISNLRKIRFDIVKKSNHFDLSDEDKKFYQAEVLVKTWIPINMLSNIDKF
ncbi:MAG: DarT ssDNA thymidine ADP-ribosyltransferase family protein [Mucilaginibacter sp.]